MGMESRGGPGGLSGTVVIAWDVQQEYVERVRQAFPDLRIVHAPDEESARRSMPEAEVILAQDMPRALLQAAARVRWMQSVSAGVEGWFHPELQERAILLTNASGVHGTPIAEVILGMALCFATGLHTLIAAQRAPHHGRPVEGGPADDVRDAVSRQKFELAGQTMGVVGLGAIGDATARKAHALGMRVLAGRRHPGEAPPYVDRLLGAGRQDLEVLLRESDHVAICLPLTPDTDGLIGEGDLRHMKPTAYIYNVGRGATIVPDALYRALRDGWIAGAGLDVTVPDPPDHASPLWTLPNVILSQHTSGGSPRQPERVINLFIDNLRRYRGGEPLVNQVDQRLRY
ncbi:MAG: D-2-hydroxyacid dehydrogenase [Chloroflexota bacterium]